MILNWHSYQDEFIYKLQINSLINTHQSWSLNIVTVKISLFRFDCDQFYLTLESS